MPRSTVSVQSEGRHDHRRECARPRSPRAGTCQPGHCSAEAVPLRELEAACTRPQAASPGGQSREAVGSRRADLSMRGLQGRLASAAAISGALPVAGLVDRGRRDSRGTLTRAKTDAAAMVVSPTGTSDDLGGGAWTRRKIRACRSAGGHRPDSDPVRRNRGAWWRDSFARDLGPRPPSAARSSCHVNEGNPVRLSVDVASHPKWRDRPGRARPWTTTHAEKWRFGG
jgi:hypothetical protein